MALRSFNPTSPARRFMTVSTFEELSKVAPEKSLLEPLKKHSGRNSYGRITVRHRGGGNKRKYRVIDFKRNKDDINATVRTIEYDPNRSANIALIEYEDGGQLVRAAGNSAQLMAKENGYAQVRLPSGEVRLIRLDCKATIGEVGNGDHENMSIGKAGRKRHMGWRPTVRGVVMNPCDHPHGGGEGKSPIGKPGPVTPWGKPTLGHKTRSKKKASNKFIVKRRNGR